MTAIQDKAHAIWVDVYDRLAELETHTGCEAGARRAFHDGRFAALKELGLVPSGISADSDEVIERRRRELDEALRPEATRQQMAFEPIVRRYPDNMQRLVHHRPACSLRDPEAHGSAATTCTCDYWLRSRVNIVTMTEPESAEATEAEDAAVEEPADEDAPE